jgi:hypothetical protein
VSRETRGNSVESVINDCTEVEVTLPCLGEAEDLVRVLATMVAVMDADATLDRREGTCRAVRDMSAALPAPTHPLPPPS